MMFHFCQEAQLVDSGVFGVYVLMRGACAVGDNFSSYDMRSLLPRVRFECNSDTRVERTKLR